MSLGDNIESRREADNARDLATIASIAANLAHVITQGSGNSDWHCGHIPFRGEWYRCPLDPVTVLLLVHPQARFGHFLQQHDIFTHATVHIVLTEDGMFCLMALVAHNSDTELANVTLVNVRATTQVTSLAVANARSPEEDGVIRRQAAAAIWRDD